jgi:hypothetical protein
MPLAQARRRFASKPRNADRWSRQDAPSFCAIYQTGRSPKSRQKLVLSQEPISAIPISNSAHRAIVYLQRVLFSGGSHAGVDLSFCVHNLSPSALFVGVIPSRSAITASWGGGPLICIEIGKKGSHCHLPIAQLRYFGDPVEEILASTFVLSPQQLRRIPLCARAGGGVLCF